MSNIRIQSTIRQGNVYIRQSDIIKSLYSDLANATDDILKKYLRAQIELWEEYEINILKQANLL